MTHACMGVWCGAMQGPMAVRCAKNTAMMITGWTVLITRPVEAVAGVVVPLWGAARVTVAVSHVAVVPLWGAVRVTVAVSPVAVVVGCVTCVHG